MCGLTNLSRQVGIQKKNEWRAKNEKESKILFCGQKFLFFFFFRDLFSLCLHCLLSCSVVFADARKHTKEKKKSSPKMGALITKKTKTKVLFISYEYTFGTFSGNGVLAASTVRGFLNDDSDFDDDDAMTTEILVVCARPTELEEELRMEKEDEEEDKGVLSVPVPKSKWGRLDKTCAYEEFATNVSEKQLEAIVKFRADVVLGVDWSSLEVYERIRKRYQEEEEDGFSPPPPPLTYLNYRVFTLHDESHRALEQRMITASTHVICLCINDAKFLRDAFVGGDDGKEMVVAVVLHPPLREDVLRDAKNALAREQPSLVTSTTGAKKKRNALTCVVRLSKEKEPERFVELVEELAKRDAFGDTLVPILVAPATSEFAEGLKKRFREATKNIPNASELCIESFLNATQLGEIYSRTKLNVHPCRKDAYGMTVIEAAAFGAPSLVCSGGKVGSSELLMENQGVFSFDYENKSVEALADFITNIDENRLEEVAKIGRERALAYDETEYARLISKGMMIPKERGVETIRELAESYANALIAFSLDYESRESVTIMTRSRGKDDDGDDVNIISSSSAKTIELEGWIITADNPHSMNTGIGANAIAKKALEHELLDAFPRVQLGRSLTSEYDSDDPDEMKWIECGYFVPFIGYKTEESKMSVEQRVLEIGRNFGQNAVYFISRTSGEKAFKVTVVPCCANMDALRSTVEMVPRKIPSIRRQVVLDY